MIHETYRNPEKKTNDREIHTWFPNGHACHRTSDVKPETKIKPNTMFALRNIRLV